MPRYFWVYAVVFFGLAVIITILSVMNIVRTGHMAGGLIALMAWFGWISFIFVMVIAIKNQRHSSDR